MKRSFIVIALLLAGIVVKAQTKQPAITDDDLKKYALTMDSVKGMQETLVKIITENVQKNTVMPVSRYNELFKLTGDSTKLTATGATVEEKAFLKEIEDLRKYNNERINKAYQALVKDYVGIKTFNSIKKGIEADPKLKARFDAVSQEIQSTKGAQTPATDSKGR